MTSTFDSQQAGQTTRGSAAPSEQVWHQGQSPALPGQQAHALILLPRKATCRYVVEMLLTAVLWLAFAGLCLLFLGRRSWRDVPHWGEFLPDFLLSMLVIAALYLLVLAIGAAVLGIWAAFNKFRASRRPAGHTALRMDEREVMRAFEVSRTMLDRLHACSVATVFLDDEGEITSVRTGCLVSADGNSPSQLPPDSFIPTQWGEAWDHAVSPRGSMPQPLSAAP